MFKKKEVPLKTKRDAEPAEDEVQEDSFLSSSADDDFFKEPGPGGEEAGTGEEPFDMHAGESSSGLSSDFAFEADESSNDSGEKRKKILLLLFLIIAAGYAVYAYVIPQYFPGLLPGAEVAGKAKAPDRVPIKVVRKAVPAPPKPAEPVPVKPEPKPVVAVEKKEAAAAPKMEPAVEKAAKKVPEEKLIEDKPKLAEKPETIPAPPSKPAIRPAASVKPAAATGKIRVVKAYLPVAEKNKYFVQSGVFIFAGNVNAPKKKIESLGYSPRVANGRKVVNMNRLTIGNLSDANEAKDLAARLKKEGYDPQVDLIKGKYSVIIGSYYYRNVAVEEKIILEAKGYKTSLTKKPVKMKVHHLLVGPYNTPEEAAGVKADLKKKGLKTAIIQSL